MAKPQLDQKKGLPYACVYISNATQLKIKSGYFGFSFGAVQFAIKLSIGGLSDYPLKNFRGCQIHQITNRIQLRNKWKKSIMEKFKETSPTEQRA